MNTGEMRNMKENNNEMQKAYAVMWEGKDDDNGGFIYGIEYMDGEEVSDVEWFRTSDERDAELQQYIFDEEKRGGSMSRSREEMTNALIERDIAWIEEGFITRDRELLWSVLSGDGWVPYNQLTDEQVIETYNEAFGEEEE